MSARLPIVIGVGVLLFLHCNVFAARSIIISGDKSSLFGEEVLTVTSSISGFSDDESIYLKGAFYKEGSSNYFGFTKKNDEWVKNGTSISEQKRIDIKTWDHVLQVRSDFLDGGYVGEGEYKVKVGFYYQTSGGNLSSVNWSGNSLTMTLNEPDSTPTNTPTPTQEPTSTHTPTPISSSSNTPTKTPTPVQSGTITPTKTVSPSGITDASGSGLTNDTTASGNVLGEEQEQESASGSGEKNFKTTLVSIFSLFGAGSGLLGIASVLYKGFFKKDGIMRYL